MPSNWDFMARTVRRRVWVRCRVERSWDSRWVSWVARVMFEVRRDWRWVDEDNREGWDVDGLWTRECWREGEVRMLWSSGVLRVVKSVCRDIGCDLRFVFDDFGEPACFWRWEVRYCYLRRHWCFAGLISMLAS